MPLTKNVLTKALNKGRMEAEVLLRRLAAAGGAPAPEYRNRYNGNRSDPEHNCTVRFSVPKFLRDDERFGVGIERETVQGAGLSSTKKAARTLASLEVVHSLQEEAGMPLGGLERHMREWEAMCGYDHDAEITKGPGKKKEIKVKNRTPVDDVGRQVRGVSWRSVPTDPSFEGHDRTGRIRFIPQVVDSPRAFATAKALTLKCRERLPQMVFMNKHRDKFGELMPFMNIRPNCGPNSKVVIGPQHTDIRDKDVAELRAMMKGYQKYGKFLRKRQKEESVPTSFGMAKIFASVPRELFTDLRLLMQQLDTDDEHNGRVIKKRITTKKGQTRKRSEMIEDEKLLESRVQALQRHQERTPLPVDSVSIPHDAAVTIVEGGTGSGKTTRYPMMLSLSSPAGPGTKVLVAQPRRLACQAAARRVAHEQDVVLGSEGCPVGYSVRFESVPSTARQRTLDFQTPGVILRRAMEDPLLGDVTHLVLDEVHERNADMDLLVAMAREAQRRRLIDDPDNPLRVVLMSATLDAPFWEGYFRPDDGKAGDDNTDGSGVVIVEVSSERRFPVDVVHFGEKGFSEKNLGSVKAIDKPRESERRFVLGRLKKHAAQLEVGAGETSPADDADGSDQSEDEGDFCSAAAELATTLIATEEVSNGGSILVFLPGMDEIKSVDRQIGENAERKRIDKPAVRYLHSSLSSEDHQKVFAPGTKIILSTNIAETSVTIPDVKVVIDAGKEKQLSMLDDSGTEGWMSVVGSELTTVNISRAAAEQRSGRAGRVSAGMCYRLYNRSKFENEFPAHTKPEMLRIDLAQMILHSLSTYQPESGRPLELLLRTPDPPPLVKLKQALRSLKYLGLVDGEIDDGDVFLTPLGRAVSLLPTSPRIGRMIYMGLVLRAVDPALQIAALLSVPNVFRRNEALEKIQHTSDLARMLKAYQMYLERGDSQNQRITTLDRKFQQVSRVENQLRRALMDGMRRRSGGDAEWSEWNANASRLAATVALACNATPHIAHMVGDKNDFATRDVAGGAKIHPGSCNFSPEARAHWYLYHELRTTSAPYLHVTTAVSPLELILFAEATTLDEKENDFSKYKDRDDNLDNWLFLADQWIPVALMGHRSKAFDKLRKLLSHDFLQLVSQDPEQFISNPLYSRIILYVLFAIERQRVDTQDTKKKGHHPFKHRSV